MPLKWAQLYGWVLLGIVTAFTLLSTVIAPVVLSPPRRYYSFSEYPTGIGHLIRSLLPDIHTTLTLLSFAYLAVQGAVLLWLGWGAVRHLLWKR